eukprot:295521-Chlamydomonas_euryale.AAC.1
MCALAAAAAAALELPHAEGGCFQVRVLGSLPRCVSSFACCAQGFKAGPEPTGTALLSLPFHHTQF